ncbi:MAG: hypothetical protein WBZ48_13800 [Bacteroidota bacterium]
MSILRKLFQVAILLGVLTLVLLSSGCTKKGDAIPSDEINPVDPEGVPPPKTQLTKADTSGSTVTLAWTVKNPNSVYKFLIVFTQGSDTLRVDTAQSTTSTKTYSNLDDGTNLVTVQAISTARVLEDAADGTNQKTFTINAVQGPALMVFPRTITVLFGHDFTFKIRAKGVNAFVASNFVVQLSPSTAIDAYNWNTGNFVIDTTLPGQIKVYLADIGGATSGVTGTIDLIVFHCHSVSPGSTSLNISGAQFVNNANTSFSISNIIDGIVNVIAN